MEIRILNVLLGIWLFLSALVWPHATAQRINTIVLGVVCTLVAVAAMRVDPVRWVNLLLGIWLIASVLILPRQSWFGLWNNMLVGIAMILISGVRGVDREILDERAAA